MRNQTWQPKPPKPPAKPDVADDVREAVDAQAALVIAALKKRGSKRPKNPRFNSYEDLFTRWHRDALYFVFLMRTPHGRPETFESHAARMEHAGKGKFNLAVPMRRGWNTVMRNSSPEECLKRIAEFVHF